MAVVRFSAFRVVGNIRIACKLCEHVLVIPRSAKAGNLKVITYGGANRIIDASTLARLHECDIDMTHWCCVACGLEDIETTAGRKASPWRRRSEAYRTPTCPRCAHPLTQYLVA